MVYWEVKDVDGEVVCMRWIQTGVYVTYGDRVQWVVILPNVVGPSPIGGGRVIGLYTQWQGNLHVVQCDEVY